MTGAERDHVGTRTTTRTGDERSWLRCGRCGKSMTVLVGGKSDLPGDLHHCANCDPDPVEVWL